MSPREVSVCVVLGLCLVIAAYDLFVCVAYGTCSTISAVVYTASQKWPLVPFLMGMLAGHHLFWAQSPPEEPLSQLRPLPVQSAETETLAEYHLRMDGERSREWTGRHD